MAVETNQTKRERGAQAAMPKLLRPYLSISGYYMIVAAALALVISMQPEIVRFLPIGGAAQFGAVGPAPFEPLNQGLGPTRSTLTEGVKLALSILASFLLMLPVTWICMGARRRKDVSQSFIQTILVLPMVITGVVHIAHNSLALAFSLAGIVAAVRFRHTLKDSAETTYLFTAIAAGLACGINATGVAAIVSIFFNYTVLALWATEYGAQGTSKPTFSHEWMAKDDGAEPEENANAHSGREDD